MTAMPPSYVAADLCVDPDKVAAAIGVDPDALTDTQRETIEDAIRDAQADVEAHLGRAIMPTEYRAEGQVQYRGKWDLPEQPIITVDTVTAETTEDGYPTGRYTVDYTAGLNARATESLRPIRRYVALAAALAPAVTRIGQGARPITSLSVDGQSVTFGDSGKPGDGAPGSVPTLASLDRWRLRNRRVFSRRGDHPPVIEPVAWRR